MRFTARPFAAAGAALIGAALIVGIAIPSDGDIALRPADVALFASTQQPQADLLSTGNTQVSVAVVGAPILPAVLGAALISGDERMLYAQLRPFIDQPLYLADPLLDPVSRQLMNVALGTTAAVMAPVGLVKVAEAIADGDKIRMYLAFREYFGGPLWVLNSSVTALVDALAAGPPAPIAEAEDSGGTTAARSEVRGSLVDLLEAPAVTEADLVLLPVETATIAGDRTSAVQTPVRAELVKAQLAARSPAPQPAPNPSTTLKSASETNKVVRNTANSVGESGNSLGRDTNNSVGAASKSDPGKAIGKPKGN